MEGRQNKGWAGRRRRCSGIGINRLLERLMRCVCHRNDVEEAFSRALRAAPHMPLLIRGDLSEFLEENSKKTKTRRSQFDLTLPKQQPSRKS